MNKEELIKRAAKELFYTDDHPALKQYYKTDHIVWEDMPKSIQVTYYKYARKCFEIFGEK